jgi:hypothetical protein
VRLLFWSRKNPLESEYLLPSKEFYAVSAGAACRKKENNRNSSFVRGQQKFADENPGTTVDRVAAKQTGLAAFQNGIGDK